MANNFAFGSDVKARVKVESTYDTAAAFSATDGIGLIDLKIDPSKEFQLSKERVGTASAQAMIAGMSGGKWSAVSEIKPNAVGVAPDSGELIRAALGTETISGGVSVTYSLNDSAPNSLQLDKYVGAGLCQIANGAWVEQMDIEIQGNAPPKMSLSGGFATYGWVHGAEVNTNALITATTVYYKTAHKGNLGVNGRVKFGTEDAAGAGYLITAVDDTASPPSITISPQLAAGISADAVIAPLVPTLTLSGTLLGGVSAGLTVDGSSVNFISGKIQIKTGLHGRNKEATASKSAGVLRGDREITGELQVYYIDKESGPLIGRAWAGTTRALVLRIGANTAAQRMTINIPKAFLEVVPIDVPDREEATATIKFRALQNAAAADELTLVFS